jgi:hypothetical protein
VTKVRSLSPADLRLVAACEKMRNSIVHRSPSSVDEMDTALVVLDQTVDADRVRTNRVTGSGIAAYLHAQPRIVTALLSAKSTPPAARPGQPRRALDRGTQIRPGDAVGLANIPAPAGDGRA